MREIKAQGVRNSYYSIVCSALIVYVLSYCMQNHKCYSQYVYIRNFVKLYNDDTYLKLYIVLWK